MRLFFILPFLVCVTVIIKAQNILSLDVIINDLAFIPNIETVPKNITLNGDPIRHYIYFNKSIQLYLPKTLPDKSSLEITLNDSTDYVYHLNAVNKADDLLEMVSPQFIRGDQNSFHKVRLYFRDNRVIQKITFTNADAGFEIKNGNRHTIDSSQWIYLDDNLIEIEVKGINENINYLIEYKFWGDHTEIFKHQFIVVPPVFKNLSIQPEEYLYLDDFSDLKSPPEIFFTLDSNHEKVDLHDNSTNKLLFGNQEETLLNYTKGEQATLKFSSTLETNFQKTFKVIASGQTFLANLEILPAINLSRSNLDEINYINKSQTLIPIEVHGPSLHKSLGNKNIRLFLRSKKDGSKVKVSISNVRVIDALIGNINTLEIETNKEYELLLQRDLHNGTYVEYLLSAPSKFQFQYETSSIDTEKLNMMFGMYFQDRYDPRCPNQDKAKLHFEQCRHYKKDSILTSKARKANTLIDHNIYIIDHRKGTLINIFADGKYLPIKDGTQKYTMDIIHHKWNTETKKETISEFTISHSSKKAWNLNKLLELEELQTNEFIDVRINPLPTGVTAGNSFRIYRKKRFSEKLGFTLAVPPFLAAVQRVEEKKVDEQGNVSFDEDNKEWKGQALPLNLGFGIKYRLMNKFYEPSPFAFGIYGFGVDVINQTSRSQQKNDLGNDDFVGADSFNIGIVGEYSIYNLDFDGTKNSQTKIPLYLGALLIPNPINENGSKVAFLVGIGIELTILGSD